MTFQAEVGDERAGLVVPVRDARQQPFPAPIAASEACHLDVGAALAHKDQSGHRLDGQLLMPVRSSCGYAGPIAPGGGQSFF